MDDYFELGHFSRTVGLKGHLVLHPESDNPEYYAGEECLYVEENGQYLPYFVEEIKWESKGYFRVKLEEMHSEDDARRMVRKAVFLPLSRLPELEKDQFYYHEVIGFDVVDTKLGKVGTVVDVWDQSAQALFVIKNGEIQHLIPIVDDFLVEVDKTKGLITTQLPEGILDL
jgi:16S rRNA processing protein RimM